MRNGDVRRACLALIHNRVTAEVPTADPHPMALGWHLERGYSSLNAMSALCAGALTTVAAPARWRPSAMLGALLNEYGALRGDRRGGERSSPARVSRAAEALH